MPVHSVERKLAAIFAADIAGYSRLMARDEVGTLARLKACRVIIDELIAAHRGRIFNTAGDSVVADFASAVDAVQCAVAVQTALATENVGGAVDEPMQFRIGVHIGDVMVDGSNLLGDGVNIAARLEALAAPGGICVSRVVRDQVQDKLAFSFEDLGEQSVKNIARPVHAYAVSLDTAPPAPVIAVPAHAGAPGRGLVPRRAVIIAASVIAVIGIAIVAWWAWPMGSSTGSSTASVQAPTAASLQGSPSPATADAKATQAAAAPLLSIVVLPFANLSNDPEQEYFADAITEDLTTDLSRIADSFVIARNTAFSYKGKTVDVKQLGRELGIRYVLEGSVRRLGDQVQVNVQLVDAASGAHLWADRFETDRRNLAQAQSEITGRLGHTLNLQLVAAAYRRIELEKAIDPDARDFVMRGRALFSRPASVVTHQEALREFERAHAIDPGSVDARVGIARVLVVDVTRGWSKSVQQDLARAEQLLTEGLERDPGSTWAHYAMGLLRRLQNRLPESKIEFETVIALDRNFANAFTQLGQTLTFMGQPEAAIPQVEKAIRLNPHDPSIWLADLALGSCHLLLGHVDGAIDLFHKARAANPRIAVIHSNLAAALGLKGEIDEARAALAEAIKLRPEANTLARLRALCASCDNPQYRALAEKTVYAGLRRAGLPDE